MAARCSLKLLRTFSGILVTTGLFIVTLHGQDFTPAQIRKQPVCSLARTNENCKLIIDRSNPVSPSTAQMYSDQIVTVVIKNPKDYERYFLDYQTGQATVTPDVTSSIVQGLLPAMGKVTEFTAKLYGTTPPPVPNPCADPKINTKPALKGVPGVVPAFQACLEELAEDAIDIYKELEPSLAPDSRIPNGNSGDADLDGAQSDIGDFLKAEFAVSSRISIISNDSALKASDPDAPAIVQLTDLQKLADAVANDLLSYSQRITDLLDFDNPKQPCEGLIDLTKKEITDKVQCVYISSRKDDQRIYQNMVTRTITYAVNTLNLIANSQQAATDSSKKKLLATVAINFADTPDGFPGELHSAFRWEASAGAFFSSLPVRSFSAAPVFTNGMVGNKIIAQNILHPTVVPFAAANYRLTNDLKWTRWKSGVYWTSAVGINPNTVTADFATGLSLSYRALMISGLCHFGHDIRLTQGLTVGESLGAGFNGSLATQTYWTTAFALGVSIRVPALTGR
jgi:hypothetical protein